MTTPKRIQRKRTKGWRMPEGAVYVGRPTKWGNPYSTESYSRVALDDSGEPFLVPLEARQRWAVADFESMLDPNFGTFQYPTRDEIREALADHDLACWCPLDQPCHADVLLEIANAHTHPERLRSLAHQEESA